MAKPSTHRIVFPKIQPLLLVVGATLLGFIVPLAQHWHSTYSVRIVSKPLPVCYDSTLVLLLSEFALFALLIVLVMHFTLLALKQKARLEQLNQDWAQSNSLLKATLEATADGILVLDAQGRKVNFNTRFIQMWQVPDRILQSLKAGSDEEMMPFVLSQLKNPEAFIRSTQQMMSQPEGETFDVLELKDGRIFERYSYPQWVSDSPQITHHTTHPEQPVGRVLSFRDVTERQHAEAAIAHSLSVLETTLEATADGIIVLDRDWGITHYNQRFLELWQLTEAQIINRDDRQLIQRMQEQLVDAEAFTQRIKDEYNNPTLTHQNTCIFADGRVFERHSQPQWLGETIIGRVVSYRDVTDHKRIEDERKQAVAALQESEERYRSVVSALSEGIVLQDAQGVICACNASAERILGLSLDQIMGQTSIDSYSQSIHEDGSLFPGSEHPSMVTLQTGLPCHEIVMGVCKPNGNLTWISINSQPLFRSGETSPYAVVASFLDITERKQAETLLRQSERRYRAIVEDQTEMIARHLPDGTLTFVNKAYCRYFGVAQAAIVGFHYEPLIFEDDRQWVAQQISSICLENPVVVFENRVIVNGEVRWTQWIGRGLFDLQGRLTELQSVGRDIHSLKQAEAELRTSEARFHAFMNHSPISGWITDIEGRILYVNQPYLHTFPTSVGKAIGCCVFDLFPTEFAQRCLNNIQTVAQTNQVMEIVESIPQADGTMGSYLVYKFPILDSSGQRLVGGVAIDITERKQIEEALFHEKELAQVTLQSIGDAVITTDALGNIEYFNPVAEALTGWSHQQVYGLPIAEVFNIVNEATGKPVVNPVVQALQQGETVEMPQQTLLIAKDGREVAIDDSAAPIRNRNGEIIGAVMVFHDVTHTRTLSQQLAWQASHDTLTGLVNRREFEHRLEQALLNAKTTNQKHALCYLDLDRFKIVNDTCGHTAGDELLRQVTALFQAQIRKTDTLARLGGDEFGVLLHQCPPEQAIRVANALRECLQGFRFIYQGQNFAIGASIGLVGVTAESESLTSLLSAADAACYSAKNKGRNRVHVFQPDDEDLLQQRGEMQWVARLTQALEDNRFCLHYQPIAAITAQDLQIDHYEVLLRLRDEQDNLISPMAFIPAAERYNLMHRIDRWVIQSLFSQWSSIANPYAKTYAINLSGASINDEEFIEFLYEQFAIYQVPPQCICFEITETIAIANLVKANQLMRELQRLGCRFALDDFGSGMSSFGYLKNLSVNYLKIDGSFVKNIAADPVDAAMVEAITRIGHVMGIKTIAEFVENDSILERIKTIGVDYAQGYGIAAPTWTPQNLATDQDFLLP